MRTALALLAFAAVAPAADLPAGAFDRTAGAAFAHPDRPTALDFHPNGKHLASAGSDGTVRVWDVPRQTLLHTLSVKDGVVMGLRYAADGKSLFVHFGDDKLRRYDPDAGYKLLGTTAARHLDKLSASADGSTVAGLEVSDKVKVLETATGLDRLELPDARTAALAPDGSAVAVVNADNVLTVYAIPGGKPLHTVRPPKGEEKALLAEVAFSPDGKRVAVAPEWIAGTVRVYELGKPEPVAEFAGEGPVRFVGQGLVAAKSRGRVVLFDPATKTSTNIGHRVGAFAVSADGKTVATDTGGGVGSARLRVWDTGTGKEVRPANDVPVGLLGTAPRPGGSAWLVTADRVFTWEPGTMPKGVAALSTPATAFAATPDRLFVATADGLRTVDARTPGEPTLLPDSPKELHALAASADGSLLAGLDSAQQLVLCDSAGKSQRAWKLPAVGLGVAVQPNGKAVAQIGRDGWVRVWDAATDPAKPVERWKARLARSPNGAVAFTPDGSAVVVASLLKVVVFDADGGRQRAAYERTWDDGPFVSVAVSADGGLVAAGTLGTNGVAVWEVASGAAVKRLTGANTPQWQLAFASDGRTLLTGGGDDSAMAWDLTDRRGKPAPTAAELATAWDALGRTPEQVWQAGWVFADAADPWTTFADGCKTARATFAAIDDNIARLNDPDFATREKASAGLLAAGSVAVPAVKAAAEKSDEPEVRRRAEELLDKLPVGANTPKRIGQVDELTRLRGAVRMAEKLGGAKAAAALDDLAKFGGEVGKAAEEAKKRVGK